jgi:hypothetical protein
MAVVFTGDPFAMLQAEAISKANYTPQQMTQIQTDMTNFLTETNVGANFIANMQHSADYFNSNEVKLISDKLLAASTGFLDTNVYKPLDYLSLKTESNVTKSFMMAHPSMFERVNKGLVDSYEEDIGVIQIMNLNSNPYYNEVMVGVDNNPFMRDGGFIEHYEHYNGAGIEQYKLNGKNKISAIETYNILEEVVNLGLDFV